MSANAVMPGGPLSARLLSLVAARRAAVAAAAAGNGVAPAAPVVRFPARPVDGHPDLVDALGVVLPASRPVASSVTPEGLRGPLRPDPDPDGTETRAAAADAARALLRVETWADRGSAVRAYRSRKGHAWPGHRPEAHGDPTPPAVRSVARYGVGLRPAATLADLRTWQAFDPVTVRDAFALVERLTVAHRWRGRSCECNPGPRDRCVCGARSARRDDTGADGACACGANRGAVCHAAGHVPERPDDAGPEWLGLRPGQAARLRRSVEARLITGTLAIVPAAEREPSRLPESPARPSAEWRAGRNGGARVERSL